MLRLYVVLLVVVALGSVASSAHVGGHGSGQLRTWRWNDDGSHHIHGSFHSVRGNVVMIEDAKGHLNAIPIEMLSEADRALVTAKVYMIAGLRDPIHLQPTVSQDVVGQSNQEHVEVVHLVAAGCVLFVVLGTALLASSVLRRLPKASPLRTGLATAILMLSVMALTPSMEAGLASAMVGTDPTVIDASFAPFKPRVTTRWDATYFYVEHDGMPMDMPAMKGITAWQQQVPIPQNYRGTNAWSIPLVPVPAAKPVSLDTALHTGAVALAVNGLPIFNPENNRGEFSYDIGELDAYGGHCGRADDYHYHLAPTHLTERLGPAVPIAWALDGYPLYGYVEPDGTPVQTLDANLGHEWNGAYHYHAIKTRPYMIASMRGVITIDRDQVVPQSRATPARPFLQALRGAVITDLHACDTNHYALKYTVESNVYWVNYRWTSTGAFTYVVVGPDGSRAVSNYQRK